MVFLLIFQRDFWISERGVSSEQEKVKKDICGNNVNLNSFESKKITLKGNYYCFTA
jgi:hypothetical protein